MKSLIYFVRLCQIVSWQTKDDREEFQAILDRIETQVTPDAPTAHLENLFRLASHDFASQQRLRQLPLPPGAGRVVLISPRSAAMTSGAGSGAASSRYNLGTPADGFSPHVRRILGQISPGDGASPVLRQPPYRPASPWGLQAGGDQGQDEYLRRQLEAVRKMGNQNLPPVSRRPDLASQPPRDLVQKDESVIPHYMTALADNSHVVDPALYSSVVSQNEQLDKTSRLYKTALECTIRGEDLHQASLHIEERDREEFEAMMRLLSENTDYVNRWRHTAVQTGEGEADREEDIRAQLQRTDLRDPASVRETLRNLEESSLPEMGELNSGFQEEDPVQPESIISGMIDRRENLRPRPSHLALDARMSSTLNDGGVGLSEALYSTEPDISQD